MEGHAKKCVERYCELANKTTQQFFKIATPRLDDHHFKKEENESVGEFVYSLLTNCSEMSVFGSYWQTWHFVVCEQTCSCGYKLDKSLLQTIISFDLLHSPNKWIQTILSCGQHSTTMQTCIVSRRWFCRRPWRLKINIRRGFCVFSEVTRLCQEVGCARNTDVSFTQFYRSWSNLSRCRLCIGGIPALDLWDLVIAVFHSVPNTTEGPKRELRWNPSATVKPNMHNPVPIKHTNVIPTNIDHIPNTTHSDSSAVLNVFLDNEAVITPELPWIGCLTGLIWSQKFKSVTLTPNTNSQTCWLKRTRDEWNNLLCLFNISHFTSTCCAKNFSLISCSTMAKRSQNQKELQRVVSKSRPAVMNISSYLMASSSSAASSPIASKIPGVPIALGKPVAGWILNQTHSTQRRRLKCDSRMHILAGWWKGSGETRRMKKQKEDSDKLAAGTWYYKEEPAAQNNRACEETPCTRSQFFSSPGKSKEYGSDLGPLSSHIAGHIALFGSRLLHGQEDLWKTTRRSCGRFECEFGYLMNVHEYHSSSSSSFRKRQWHEFEICKELSLEHNRTAFQGNGKADQWSDWNHWHKPNQFPRFKVSTSLFAQSSLSICHSLPKSLLRLCALLGKMGPDLVKSWKNQIQWYSENNYFSELNRIDGQPMEFEWNIFVGFTTVRILDEIQQMMGKLQCEPADFTKAESSTCQCWATLYGMQKDMMNYV